MSDTNNTQDGFNEEDFLDMTKQLENDVNERAHREGILNLKELSVKQLEELKNFKKMRLEMIGQRDALNASIKIMDKRIEIALATLSTIQK